MILPTKRLPDRRSLLVLGADILRLLDEPKTISRLWEDFKKGDSLLASPRRVTFDWFVLALDLLYAMRLIALEEGLLLRSAA